MSFLVCGATVTLEFVVTAQRLRVAKIPQATCDRGVLLNIDAEVEKVLILAGHGFTIEAPGLTGENALKYITDPGGLFGIGSSIGIASRRLSSTLTCSFAPFSTVGLLVSLS